MQHRLVYGVFELSEQAFDSFFPFRELFCEKSGIKVPTIAQQIGLWRIFQFILPKYQRDFRQEN